MTQINRAINLILGIIVIAVLLAAVAQVAMILLNVQFGFYEQPNVITKLEPKAEIVTLAESQSAMTDRIEMAPLLIKALSNVKIKLLPNTTLSFQPPSEIEVIIKRGSKLPVETIIETKENIKMKLLANTALQQNSGITEITLKGGAQLPIETTLIFGQMSEIKKIANNANKNKEIMDISGLIGQVDNVISKVIIEASTGTTLSFQQNSGFDGVLIKKVTKLITETTLSFNQTLKNKEIVVETIIYNLANENTAKQPSIKIIVQQEKITPIVEEELVEPIMEDELKHTTTHS